MTYFVKTSKKDLHELIDGFLFAGGSYYIQDVLSAALKGEGLGLDFWNLFLKGDDWDMETESYYFPVPIDDNHALIESTAFVDDEVNDSEIGYIPLQMLYKSFAKVVEEKSPTTVDIPALKKMLEELKDKWHIN